MFENFEELHTVAYNHRNSVVLVSYFVSYERNIIPTRYSPRKEVTGQPVECSLRFWCPALVWASVAQEGMGPHVKGTIQHVSLSSHCRLQGGSKQPGVGLPSTRPSTQSIWQARVSPVILLAALCR